MKHITVTTHTFKTAIYVSVIVFTLLTSITAASESETLDVPLHKCIQVYKSSLRFENSAKNRVNITPVLTPIPRKVPKLYFAVYPNHTIIVSDEGKRKLLKISKSYFIEKVSSNDEIILWTLVEPSPGYPFYILSKYRSFDFIGPKYFMEIYQCS